MNLMRALFGFWELLLFTATLWAQTTIVAVRAPDEIVLGADSKQTYDYLAPTVVCKIEHVGNVFYAISGIPFHEGTGYDVSRLVKETCRGCGVAEKAKVLEPVLRAAVSKLMTFVRDHLPEIYRKRFANKQNEHPPLGLVLAGFENDVPIVVVMEFTITDSTSSQVAVVSRIRSCPGDCPTGTHGYYLGSHKSIDAFLATNKHSWSSSWEEFVRRMVQLEIDNNGSEVGPPIDILRITKRGSEWIQKKQHCQ